MVVCHRHVSVCTHYGNHHVMKFQVQFVDGYAFLHLLVCLLLSMAAIADAVFQPMTSGFLFICSNLPASSLSGQSFWVVDSMWVLSVSYYIPVPSGHSCADTTRGSENIQDRQIHVGLRIFFSGIVVIFKPVWFPLLLEISANERNILVMQIKSPYLKCLEGALRQHSYVRECMLWDLCGKCV